MCCCGIGASYVADLDGRDNDPSQILLYYIIACIAACLLYAFCICRIRWPHTHVPHATCRSSLSCPCCHQIHASFLIVTIVTNAILTRCLLAKITNSHKYQPISADINHPPFFSSEIYHTFRKYPVIVHILVYTSTPLAHPPDFITYSMNTNPSLEFYTLPRLPCPRSSLPAPLASTCRLVTSLQPMSFTRSIIKMCISLFSTTITANHLTVQLTVPSLSLSPYTVKLYCTYCTLPQRAACNPPLAHPPPPPSPTLSSQNFQTFSPKLFFHSYITQRFAFFGKILAPQHNFTSAYVYGWHVTCSNLSYRCTVHPLICKLDPTSPYDTASQKFRHHLALAIRFS